MKLIKWYMDFISDEGETWLGYAAKLNFMGLPLGYSAILKGDMKEPFTARYSLKSRFPEQYQNNYQWNASYFNCKMQWQGVEELISSPVQLWESEDGGVLWHNQLPRAEAQLQFEGKSYRGLGYVECLTMNLPPWKLPIKILRWGRFVSGNKALVWIHWILKDKSERQWLFLDGIPVECMENKKNFIRWEDGTLEIYEGQIIREGLLKDTAFSQTPFLKILFPKSVLHINEYKRLASGELRLTSGKVYKGWIIDETVSF